MYLDCRKENKIKIHQFQQSYNRFPPPTPKRRPYNVKQYNMWCGLNFICFPVEVLTLIGVRFQMPCTTSLSGAKVLGSTRMSPQPVKQTCLISESKQYASTLLLYAKRLKRLYTAVACLAGSPRWWQHVSGWCAAQPWPLCVIRWSQTVHNIRCQRPGLTGWRFLCTTRYTVCGLLCGL